MAKFSRAQLQEALVIFNAARDRASQSGDWRIWAGLFTEDAHYVEHAYGEMHGRQAIEPGVISPDLVPGATRVSSAMNRSGRSSAGWRNL